MSREAQKAFAILLAALFQVAATADAPALHKHSNVVKPHEVTNHKSALQSLPSPLRSNADFDTNDVGFAEHSGSRRHLLQNLWSSLAGALLGTGTSSSSSTTGSRSTTTPASSNNFFAPSPPPPPSFTFTQSKTPAPPTPTSYSNSQPPPSYNSYNHPPPPPTPNYASSSFSSNNAQPPPYSSNHPPPPPPPAFQYANNPPPYQSYNSQPPPPAYARNAAPPPPTGQLNSAPPPPSSYSSGSGPPPPAPYNGFSSEAAKTVPPPPSTYQAAPPPPSSYSSGSAPPPPYNGLKSEAVKSVPPPPNTLSGGTVPPPPPRNAFSSETGKTAPPPPSLGSINAAPPPPQMLAASLAAAPPPPLGAVAAAPPPPAGATGAAQPGQVRVGNAAPPPPLPQVAGGTALAQAQVPPPGPVGVNPPGPPPPVGTSNDGVQAVSTQAAAPPPPIGALKDATVPKGSSGAVLAGSVTAPPPPIQNVAPDCGVGSSHPLTKCPATSGTAGLANKAAPPPPMPQVGLGSSATLASAAAPPPPLPMQGATAGGVKGSLNPGATAQAPPPPVIAGTAINAGQGAKAGTKSDGSTGLGVSGNGGKGTGSTGAAQSVSSAGTGTGTGTGTGSQQSATCSSGSCVAGYVAKDASSMKQQVVKSNAVPNNLPNQPVSAASQQLTSQASSGTGSTAVVNNVMAKGAATVATYPGAFTQQANSAQQTTPLKKANFQGTAVSTYLTDPVPITGTASAQPSANNPTAPGGTTTTPNSNPSVPPAVIPQPGATTNAQANGVDVAMIIQQYLVPTIQEIPTIIQSVQSIFQLFSGGGGGGVGGAGSGGTPVGGAGGATDPGGAGAVAAGSAVPGQGDQASVASAGAVSASSSGTDPAQASVAQPSGGSGATDPQQPGGSGGATQPSGTANPTGGDAQAVSAGVSGAQGAQVPGQTDGVQQPSDSAGSAQPAGAATSTGGAQQPSDPASSGGASNPSGAVQQSSDPAGSTQPAGGVTPTGGAQQPSDPVGIASSGGVSNPSGAAQLPSDPGAATNPTGGAQQPSNPSGAAQPAGAAGAAGSALPGDPGGAAGLTAGTQSSGPGGAVQPEVSSDVGGVNGGTTALSGSKLQVQSLLQLGPGPDTLRPIGTGGGRGLLGGSYGASSAMPSPVDPNRSVQQPKPRLYVLPNCLYMIRAGDLCGSTGSACGLTWDKIAGCGPQQLPGGCCQPGFSCRVDSDMQNKCLALPAPSYNFSDPACSPITFKGSCGKDGDCCPDGWTCQAQQGASPSCQPAMASLIPPGIESLILDYQSAKAMPGYYPGEDGQPAGDTAVAATSLQAGVPVPAATAIVSGRRLSQDQPMPAIATDASGTIPAPPAGAASAATTPASANATSAATTPASAGATPAATTPASASATSAATIPASANATSAATTPASASATPAGPADSSTPVPITGIGSLQLSQYSGIWGGKWCHSKFDPPSLDANTSAKPECPRVNGTPLPDLRPVYLPPIVSLANGSILTAGPNGTQRAIALKAFNWGGFDDGSTFLSGLYANRSMGVGDMAIVSYRAQLLGFNAVRLPFRFSDLNLAPKNWSFRCDLQTYDQIKAGVSQTNLSSQPLPLPSVLPSYSAAQSGFCNVYIPNVSTLARFLWVVEYFVNAGFYVIPAYHPADYSVDNTVVSTPGIFLRNWANLWAAITELPLYNTTLQGRILLDLISEPDIFGLEWAATTSRRDFVYPPLPDLYGPTMQVILSIDPGVFFLLEGTGQAGKYPGMAWGSGFVTDPSIVKQYNLSDPSAFFENLVQLPELYTRVIFSPHVYGPRVTGWSHGTQGGDLWNMLQVGFNWLATTGYTAKNGTGPLRFPIVVGELGSSFDSDHEVGFFKDFLLFSNNVTDAVKQPLSNLPSWAWYTEGPGASTLPQYINGSVIWPAMNAMTIGLSNDTQNGGLRLVPWYLASNGTRSSRPMLYAAS